MSDKLASTEQMFGTPFYCGLLVDQSILFNRRRDGSQSAKVLMMYGYPYFSEEGNFSQVEIYMSLNYALVQGNAKGDAREEES